MNTNWNLDRLCLSVHTRILLMLVLGCNLVEIQISYGLILLISRICVLMVFGQRICFPII